MKLILALLFIASLAESICAADARPNIIFVMADDMGWGETSYRGHPVLKTPNLDAMAANGLRLDRFYAGCPVCSPTRASVLTGRANDRTGVLSHGYALRLQEKTIAQALRAQGYITAHFGKWHLNGLKGPGVPIFTDDPYSPGTFGFEHWVSVSNYFDLNPLMSREGVFTEFKGDSSDVIVSEAISFIEKHHAGAKPFFSVIWFGSPHGPSRALPEDKAAFGGLNANSQDHYGELVALDRSVGTLRQKLRDLGIAENTLVVFCSDNGGLSGVQGGTVGGLRGNKGTVFEGGLRVPGIIEWPAVIKTPRITKHPACTMDLFPTVADILGMPAEVMTAPVDGVSLKRLLTSEIGAREKAIPFRYGAKAALVDNKHKLLTENLGRGVFQLYDLEADPNEEHDLSDSQPELAARMKQQLLEWNASVDASFAGKDYPEGRLSPPDMQPIQWRDDSRYQPYLPEWDKRWEYSPAPKIKRGKAPKK